MPTSGPTVEVLAMAVTSRSCNCDPPGLEITHACKVLIVKNYQRGSMGFSQYNVRFRRVRPATADGIVPFNFLIASSILYWTAGTDVASVEVNQLHVPFAMNRKYRKQP
jgi:hypothetical protein